MSTAKELVYILDDEAGMRKALERLLRSEGFEPRPFATADEFLDAHDPEAAACLVLDVAMPDIDGMELQERLTRLGVPTPIVFLTGHGDIPMSVQAIKAGAVDFLTKPVNDHDLLRAVRSGMETARRRKQELRIRATLRARHANLTPREREVMTLVVSGMLNKQIAAELGTGLQTIKIHRGRLMEKMQVASFADLVRAAETLGIQSHPPA